MTTYRHDKNGDSAESTADWVKRHKIPNDNDAIERISRSKQRAASGRVDPERLADEDAAMQAAKGTEREKERRPGETDEQYEGRMEKMLRRGMTGAEIMERDNLLCSIALQKKLAQPVIGEITAVSTGSRTVAINYSASHYKMPGNSSVQLHGGHVYRICTDGGEADLTRQVPNRPAVPLKRVAFDTIKAGMCGELVYIGGHPMGHKAVENWIMVLDDALTPADVDGTSKTGNAAQTGKGTVEALRSTGGGAGVLIVKLDDGSSISVSVALEGAPERGTRGTVNYDGDEPTFTPDAAADETKA